MARDSFENHELPRHDRTWDYPRYKYEIFFEPSGKKLLFKKVLKKSEELGKSNLQSMAKPPKTESLDIILTEHCIIEMSLRQDIDWCWNTARAIGRQDKDMDKYFDLLYWDNVDKKWVKSTERRCDRIQFSAEFRGGTETKKDTMNYNVLLEYPDGTVLPINIDPDIQNPRT